MKSVLRAAARLPGIYHVRRRRYRRAFLSDGGGEFWGQFATAAEARAFLPERLAGSYEDPALAELNLEWFKQVHLFDWPVMFHLRRFIEERGYRSLVDFGGHVGVKYHAFRQHIDFPEAFSWRVVDLPPMVRMGREQVAAGNLPQLTFHDSLAAAGPAPMLLCSGALQYTNETLAELMAGLRERPEVVILNKLPLCEHGSFYTLENFGSVRLVQRIFDSDAHEKMREELGYRLLARWAIPYRDFRIPFGDPGAQVRMFGEVWTAS